MKRGVVFQHGTPESNQSGDSMSHQIKTEVNHNAFVYAVSNFSNKRKFNRTVFLTLNNSLSYQTLESYSETIH